MRRMVEIAIASPGDVPGERDAVPGVFNRWNSAHDEAILHPVIVSALPFPTRGQVRYMLSRQ
jgi:hypothetical protein